MARPAGVEAMHYLLELLNDDEWGGFAAWFWAATNFLALCTIPSILLRRRGRPRAALSWLLALFALPAVGVLSWWAVGRTSIERKRRRRERSARAFADRHGAAHSEEGTRFDEWIPTRALGDSVFPSNGNDVQLLIGGDAAFGAMEAAIAGAERQIHALFYIWKDDTTGARLRDRLVEKAKQGVVVRVLVDAFGSPHFEGRFGEPLRRAGAHVESFLPSRLYPLRAPRFNFVNHRKILVVDETVAFTGGMNIGDEYAGEWHDLMARIRGPAVHALAHVFLDDWFFASNEAIEHIEDDPHESRGTVPCAIVASGPDREAWIHDAYFIALTQARKRIWIINPYFIPSLALLAAFRTAANRGVDVRILLPSTSDVPLVKWASRSYYPELLQVGARIFEFSGPMVHAKAMIVDDGRASVGSANLDTRSFMLSFEIGCFLDDANATAELATWFCTLQDGAHEVTLSECEGRSTAQKLLESAAHLASPLL